MDSIDGDAYIQRLSAYIRRNEESLANGLLCFSKNRNAGVKPLRISFTIHHLYYITERIESSTLGVDVGPLNVKVDNPNHEPTFISFLANNARNSRHFDSDTRSITSINSVKSMISSASVYWRSSPLKDPKSVHKDIKYLYSSCTKIPCLILTPQTKVGSIAGYEEFPCDTSVPMKMFKNLQVLELVDYEPNEIYGWHVLSEQLRILIIRNSKMSNVADVMFGLVVEDENGRTSFTHRSSRGRADEFDDDNTPFRYRKRASTVNSHGAGSLPKDIFADSWHADCMNMPISHTYSHSHGCVNSTTVAPSPTALSERKWQLLKQLTITDTSVTSIPAFVFKPLANLVKLNLSNNLLETLPEGLDQLTNIKFINLSDNYITNLGGLPRNLRNLSTLNLNNNKITNLSGLEHCPLEKVDLRRNQLSSIAALKPIVLSFMKDPTRLNNVYLAANKLPKNYRIDLFNLVNGVKYKNLFKIDDSSPGYFEKALLLDAQAAFQRLEEFFGKKDQEGLLEPFRVVSIGKENKEERKKEQGKKEEGKKEEGKKEGTLQSPIQPSFSLQSLQPEKFSFQEFTFQDKFFDKDKSYADKKFELKSTPGSPSSPLGKFESYTSRSLACVNSEVSSPSTISTMSTLKKNEYEGATGVLTALQVTARMST